MQTDIFLIERLGEHVFNIKSNLDDPKFKKLKAYKPKLKNEYTIYIHGALQLFIDKKTEKRFCIKVENNGVLLDNENKVMYVGNKITKMPIQSFPILNKYDAKISRSITVYDGHISLVQEMNKSDNKVISFMRIENDIDVASQLTKVIF
ncbi:MAG: hypothetical protein Barrevirus2_2 [Barrevirus sp.]|uniref:Uncharacterized protein n=1 Tax=Barrevirus sp. TaxID=2487763 RepID=A0A3G4ZTU8_9VIRU|nr:MAG: hypothetical protein Barrevirus2_2 [Barrevirus sp.]